MYRASRHNVLPGILAGDVVSSKPTAEERLAEGAESTQGNEGVTV